MIVYNTDLYKVLGIQFEFKRVLGLKVPFFAWWVEDYDEPGNTPETRLALVEKIQKCGPAMGFAEKQYVYDFIKLICIAAEELFSASPEALAKLQARLQSVEYYVGISGEEDFHFMVAVFYVLEAFIYAYD